MKWGRYGQFNIETAKKRFLDKTKRAHNGCLMWLGATGGGGRYGSVGFMGKPQLAHRVSWKIFNGHFPDDLCVCHKCDNGFCVEPSHLFLGTQEDNVLDMENKKRSNHPSKSKHGRAKLTENEVEEIRKLHSEGTAIRAIARMYPAVNRTTIANVIHGRTWLTK